MKNLKFNILEKIKWGICLLIVFMPFYFITWGHCADQEPAFEVRYNFEKEMGKQWIDATEEEKKSFVQKYEQRRMAENNRQNVQKIQQSKEAMQKKQKRQIEEINKDKRKQQREIELLRKKIADERKRMELQQKVQRMKIQMQLKNMKR